MTKAQINKYSNWEITCKRFVAYFDIMGFKDSVARKPPADIYYNLFKISDSFNEIQREIGQIQSDNGQLYDTETAFDENSRALVYVTKFSDSIMVFTQDESDNSLHAFIELVASFQFTLFNTSLPFRGAVAFGEFTCDIENLIFFGQPLIDAYELEQEMEFYGVIGHHTFDMAFHLRPGSKLGKKYQNFVQEHTCYFKKGVSRNNVIVPKGYEFDGPVYNVTLIGKVTFRLSEMKFSTSGPLRKYIENTQKVLAEVSKFKPI